MARKIASKRESFSFFAPHAEQVMLAGDFTSWDQNPVALKKHKDGTWKTTISLEPGAHEYRYIVDGKWADDPTCQSHRTSPFGPANCVREVI